MPELSPNRRGPRPPLVPGTVLRSDEACAVLGVSRTTLWRLTSQAGLPFIRLTANVLAFRADDIISWLEARTERSPPPAPVETKSATGRKVGRPSNVDRAARIAAAKARAAEG